MLQRMLFLHPVAWFWWFRGSHFAFSLVRWILRSMCVSLGYRSSRFVGCGIVRFLSSTCTAFDGIGSSRFCKSAFLHWPPWSRPRTEGFVFPMSEYIDYTVKGQNSKTTSTTLFSVVYIWRLTAILSLPRSATECK